MKPLSDPDFVRLKMLELRKTRGLSQKDFGSELGVSSQAVSALERGNNEWSLSHMARARSRFGLPLSFFNREAQPGEAEAAAVLKQSAQLLHRIANLSPASKAALFKYSRLTEEQRDLVDKVILETVKREDSSIIRAVLAILRKSVSPK